ncbi:DUF2818 family protein [Ideonella livida]|uniref:DUF2818 family protein n=1 Tax=Ideonella livida TaxID=2707176 RepID=A0A7C9PGP0_9BURK|nr:DUF2818 family protein [Ideonella livida]NDY91436.1 DUF2818 family protein [Ideonella livida]
MDAVIVLLSLAAAANLPFLSERWFLVIPRRLGTKGLAGCLLEWVVWMGLALGLGVALESWGGQRSPQGWAFYAAFVALGLTLAFPGFVWRFLVRRSRGAATVSDLN